MFPNILLLTIDNVRADKFNDNKSCLIPHLENLIRNGVYFDHAISGADGTTISLANIFTGCYSLRTEISTYFFNTNTETFFDVLKQNNYHTYCCIPDLQFLIKTTMNFDGKIIYPYVNRDLYVGLFGGIGNQIIEQLKSKEMKEPWSFFIHLMDAKPPITIPEEFNNMNYGNMKSDKILSAIDFWIGKILHEVNLENTLIVISSDHGNFIPITDESLDKIPKNIHKLIRKCKNIKFLEKLGFRVFLFLRYMLKKIRKNKLQNLSSYESRSFSTRTKTELFDELIRVPLIFSGYNVTQHKKISHLVRQVDIFPTIMTLLNISLNKNIDGRSLYPLIQGKNLKEIPAYIENASLNTMNLGERIGVRTSEYKYQRNRFDPTKNISLYNLKNDLLEEKNIANDHKDIVESMEQILLTIINDKSIQNEKTNLKQLLSKKRSKLTLKG